MDVCRCCNGETKIHTAYDSQGVFAVPCRRCDGTGVERNRVHSSLLLRNVRSGKVWAVYGKYEFGKWGIHRMKPARSGGHYVWQIIQRHESELLDERRWTVAGFGDAWDHDKMEPDTLRSASFAARTARA